MHASKLKLAKSGVVNTSFTQTENTYPTENTINEEEEVPEPPPYAPENNNNQHAYFADLNQDTTNFYYCDNIINSFTDIRGKLHVQRCQARFNTVEELERHKGICKFEILRSTNELLTNPQNETQSQTLFCGEINRDGIHKGQRCRFTCKSSEELEVHKIEMHSYDKTSGISYGSTISSDCCCDCSCRGCGFDSTDCGDCICNICCNGNVLISCEDCDDCGDCGNCGDCGDCGGCDCGGCDCGGCDFDCVIM